MYIEHPLIAPKTLEERAYQINIAKAAKDASSMVILPTGLGKTVIALIVIADTLKKREKGKILFLAPTKPLVEQHAATLRKHLLWDEPVVFTGEIPPAQREKLWKESQIIVSTPQVVQNDLIAGRATLGNVSLIVFDEAHRAVGEYAYTFIGERYLPVPNAKTLGMTASPGSDPEKIREVCQHLSIEKFVYRTEVDPDVAPYIQDVKMRWVRVDVPPKFKEVYTLLKGMLDGYVAALRKAGVVKPGRYVSKKDLLEAQRIIQGKLHSGQKSSAMYTAASTQAMAMKLNHGIELLETQGAKAAYHYFQRLEQEASSKSGSKASRTLMGDRKMKASVEILRDMEVEHPKIGKTVELVKRQFQKKADSRVIVFTQYRDTSTQVSEALAELPGLKPTRFVGQASRGEDAGLSQKKQVAMIEDFKDGKYNVLVATSVAEEGLDIPETDLVVFYEPIPSEIRTIQRRGRTGRKRAGEVVIIITKGTRDEAYYWSSRHKETRMRKELDIIRKTLGRGMVLDAGDGSSSPAKTRFQSPASRRRDNAPAPSKKIPPLGKEFSKKKEPTPIKKSTRAKGHDDTAQAEGSGTKPPTLSRRGQTSLLGFEDEEPEKLVITTDNREFNSEVVKELARLGIVVKPAQLPTADYVLSERCGVERKEVDDFLSSLLDGRLFQQMREIKNAYARPIVIVEGEGLFTRRNISQSAIFGALASIMMDFGIPVISTKDAKETARLLAAMAKREASQGRGGTHGVRGEKASAPIEDQQQFIVEGLPGVSGVMATRLLDHFGSVRAIFNASEEKLCKVKGVGPKSAARMRETIDAKYLKKAKK